MVADVSSPKPVLSMSLEPAYVDFCTIEDAGQMRDSHVFLDDSGKIAFKPIDSVRQTTQPSDEFCKDGQFLKAAVAFHFSQSLGKHPQPAQSSDVLLQNSCKDRDTRPALSLIATHLNELESDDPDKIVIVRKMNRLGLNSAAVLKEHFSRFGVVEKLRLANAHDRKLANSLNARLRPSGIAFVVFKSPAAASQVFAEGETQNVIGVEVSVSRFERRR